MIDFKQLIKAKQQGKITFSEAICGVDATTKPYLQHVENIEKEPSRCLAEDVSTGRGTTKKEVLHSLQEFVNHNLPHGGVKQLGDIEIVKPHAQENTPVTRFEFSPTYRSFQEYTRALSSCQQCAELCHRAVVHEFRGVEFTAPIDVLFIADRPKDFALSCFDDGGEVINLQLKEELQQHCFVDEKGAMVKRMIKKMELLEGRYALTFVVKCPVKDKSKVEVCYNNCFNNLLHEIYFLRPKVIVTFGAWCSEIMRTKADRLSRIHGQFFPFELATPGEMLSSVVVPLFHPDLLFINNDMKKTTWVDMQKIMSYLRTK